MSTIALLHLRNREKKVLAYYDDMGRGKGNCTLGFGSLVHRNPCTSDELARPVTEAQIEMLFAENVRDAERAVGRNVKIDLTQAQFDALVSYTFNRGPTGALRACELINTRNFVGAASEISSRVHVKLKNKAGKTVQVIRTRGPHSCKQVAASSAENNGAGALVNGVPAFARTT